MFQISISSSRGKSNVVTCRASSCVIGKSPDNLVVLQGWQVAGQHATLFENEGSLYLRTEDARASTLLNGKRVQGEVGPLLPTDHIEIGSYLLLAELIVDKPQTLQGLVAMSSGTTGAHESPRASESSASPGAPITRTAETDAETEARNQAEKAQRKGRATELFNRLRQIHERAIARLDLRRIDVTKFGDQELRRKTQELVEEILREDPTLSGGADRDQLIEAAVNEAIGLGPLEALLADENVTEIMVNAHDQIFIERSGKLTESEIVFSSDHAVMSAIERIVAPLGRRIDESSPMVDARLKDGSRVNAIIPPLALKGPSLSIRKFAKHRLHASDVIKFGSANKAMMDFLKLAVEQRKNILISGDTGSGKTTLLNILSNYIPEDQRVVTVEDAAELRLYQPNLVSLESRPPNVEGKGAVTIRELVKNCLRMRPDRIVVGECRGSEALDMLQAMNTGHDGSLTTAHANTPRDVLSRVEVMVLMAGVDLPLPAIRQQIASAVNLVVQQTRLSDGSRKITHITELTGIENGVIQMQDIFLFQQKGYRPDGKIAGEFVPTGCVPEFYEELVRRGIDVDRSIFFPKEEFA